MGQNISPPLQKKTHNGCVVHSYYFPGQSGRSENFLTQVHPAPWLKMSGAIPLLPLYAFMGVGPAQTGVYDT